MPTTTTGLKVGWPSLLPKGQTYSLKLGQAILLVGILVAFGIDASWQERSDRATEQDLMRALQGELIDARDGFAAHTTFLERLSRRGPRYCARSEPSIRTR